MNDNVTFMSSKLLTSPEVIAFKNALSILQSKYSDIELIALLTLSVVTLADRSKYPRAFKVTVARQLIDNLHE